MESLTVFRLPPGFVPCMMGMGGVGNEAEENMLVGLGGTRETTTQRSAKVDAVRTTSS